MNGYQAVDGEPFASAGSRMGPVLVGRLDLCSQVKQGDGQRVRSSKPARTPDGHLLGRRAQVRLAW